MAERFTYLGKQNIEKTATIWKSKSFFESSTIIHFSRDGFKRVFATNICFCSNWKISGWSTLELKESNE